MYLEPKLRKWAADARARETADGGVIATLDTEIVGHEPATNRKKLRIALPVGVAAAVAGIAVLGVLLSTHHAAPHTALGQTTLPTSATTPSGQTKTDGQAIGCGTSLPVRGPAKGYVTTLSYVNTSDDWQVSVQNSSAADLVLSVPITSALIDSAGEVVAVSRDNAILSSANISAGTTWRAKLGLPIVACHAPKPGSLTVPPGSYRLAALLMLDSNYVATAPLNVTVDNSGHITPA